MNSRREGGAKRGRPRKEPGTIPFWQFRRVAAVIPLYDEARKHGEKHCAAVQYAAVKARCLHPNMRISETEVKRILAIWRPRGEQMVMHFKKKFLTEREDIERHRWILEKAKELMESNGQKVRTRSGGAGNRAPQIIQFGFAPAPNYPRVNQKEDKK